MGKPAIRTIDMHLCPNHGPQKIGAVDELDISVNSKPALHVGEGFTCGGGARGRVSTGSTTVRYHGEFATRTLDDSDHGGQFLIGSHNVMIGGPKGMGTVGAGKSTCAQMAEGRKSRSIQQSYGNCMPESLRQLIRRATGRPVTEDEVLGHGLAHGLSDNKPGTPAHGGTFPSDAVKLLQGFGVAAENVPASGAPTLADIKQAIADRKGVVTTLHTKDYWPDGSGGYHAVMVSGVELDDNGNVTAVFLNDTGLGICGMKVPAAKIAAAIRDGGDQPLVVTKGAIW